MHATRILLVEDDAKIAAFIEKGLAQSGCAVRRCASAEEALREEGTFDALVVDIMLPGIDGLTFIERLRRRRGAWVPVLILSARQSVDDRVRGLRSGGDAYLTKPFAFSELLAQLQALLRRQSGAAEADAPLSACGIALDLAGHRALRDGKPLALQPLEFSLLAYLVRNAGRVVSKTMIMEHVWNCDFDPETNVVEVRMSCLREKLEAHGGRKVIHTIRGVGYVLRDDA